MKQEKLEKEIARRNEIWKNAKKSERAVLVAQDVLDRLKTKQIVPSPGTWVEFELAKEEGALQCEILKGEPCKCCAMGGLMISTIAFRNKITIEDLYDGRFDIDDKKFNLEESFTPTQLRLIELAFEGGNGNYSFDFDFDIYNLDLDELSCSYMEERDIKILEENVKTKNDKQNLRLIKFYKKYQDDDKARMRAIMKNIVENKGVFIP